ncbi:hypothetical protein [Clostridium muellerianum]|uniref:hypothetical protein n=1 Tax=Clostridium muellerianum TaxID=2716538 RepID=UPI001FADE803|nr:hypothetical protein [Clostridium muellerianum]
MAEGFYPTNNEVLNFYLDKDLDKIKFNHYITRKENLQRIRGGLPKGQFYMTINKVSKDLNVTFAAARGLIKKFDKIGIITNVYTPPKGCKNPSIWKYNSVIFANNDGSNEVNNGNNNEKLSDIKALDGICDNENNNDSSNEINNSKKQYIKTKNKKIYMSDSNEYRLAEYLYKYILKNNPKAKEPNLQNWAKVFDYVLRIDKRDLEEVKELIKFSQQHKFWYKNILSPDKLRKQYDRLILELSEGLGKGIMTDKLKQEKEKPKKLLGWD